MKPYTPGQALHACARAIMPEEYQANRWHEPMAEFLDVRPDTIRHWAKDRRYPPAKVFEQLSDKMAETEEAIRHARTTILFLRSRGLA